MGSIYDAVSEKWESAGPLCGTDVGSTSEGHCKGAPVTLHRGSTH